MRTDERRDERRPPVPDDAATAAPAAPAAPRMGGPVADPPAAGVERRSPFRVRVRPTTADDFAGIVALCRRVYPNSAPWAPTQLASHLAVFPEGQLVAIEPQTEEIVGMAASLVVLWDDYDMSDSWRDFTDSGMFTNHDPEHGRTLYGAEVMVDPTRQGRGIGSALYAARERIVRRLGLRRIRAGARLRGYGAVADRLTARAYVDTVVAGTLCDPTLSFQLHRGFRVLDVVPNYLRHDPESAGWAAVIEWTPVEKGSEWGQVREG